MLLLYLKSYISCVYVFQSSMWFSETYPFKSLSIKVNEERLLSDGAFNLKSPACTLPLHSPWLDSKEKVSSSLGSPTVWGGLLSSNTCILASGASSSEEHWGCLEWKNTFVFFQKVNQSNCWDMDPNKSSGAPPPEFSGEKSSMGQAPPPPYYDNPNPGYPQPGPGYPPQPQVSSPTATGGTELHQIQKI